MELLLAMMLGGFLTFNSVATPKRVEGMMEDALRKAYPAARVNATVEGKKGRAVLKGYFRRVRVEMFNLGPVAELPLQGSATEKASEKGIVAQAEVLLRDFEFQNTPIAEAELKLQGVSYDLSALKRDKRLSILGSGPGTVRLVLTAAGLEALIKNKMKGVRDVKVNLKNGKVILAGKKTLPAGLWVPFVFSARPAPDPEKGNELWLTDERIALEQKSGLSLSIDALFDRLNPIYVFDKEQQWPFAVHLTKITCGDGKMEVTANLKFVGTPAAPVTPSAPSTPLPGTETGAGTPVPANPITSDKGKSE